MPSQPIAQRISAVIDAVAPVTRFFTQSSWAQRVGDPAACDFALGNPQAMPPPWFFYEALILTYGAQPVRVKVNPEDFDLDLDAIAGAITERTRAIIINSPNNPTGKIYPPSTLAALADLLATASKRNDRTIY